MDVLTNTFDIASTATRLKRLSLELPERAHLAARPISYTKLMDVSVEHIESMYHSDEQDELLVASRILESPKSFSRWETEHSRMMHRVADQPRSRQQSTELLSATFELIHRKSLFTHLRDHQVQGRRREQLVRHYLPGHDYTRGMIAEHGVFLRSSASLACSSHLGTDLLNDAVFQQPLQDYEQLYATYFDAYCEVVLTPPDADASQVTLSVAYSLKCDLGMLRRSIGGLANRLSMQHASEIPGFAFSA